MHNNLQDIDMVVGAKGSPLQLILSAVFHIDAPTGNIPLSEAVKLQNNRFIATGIPLSYGDSYAGYRIVGTNHQYPEMYGAKIANGRLWHKNFEVTLGATVAEKLNLSVGDSFSGSHGLAEGGEAHEEYKYRVVGQLSHTNSVLDQLILTATESVWEVHQHLDESESSDEDHKHIQNPTEDHEHEYDSENMEITALLVKFRNPMGLVQLPGFINENTNMIAALPVYEINRLFNLMGVGVDTINTIAIVIMGVAGLSLFISLYNTLKERKYEMALMRTYGASRWKLVWLIMQEAILLTITGYILGIFFSRLGLWLVFSLMESNYHYTFARWALVAEEIWLLAIALVIGLISSLFPAIHVFHLNISKTLADA
jgi:putative ABC transport system permease protein